MADIRPTGNDTDSGQHKEIGDEDNLIVDNVVGPSNLTVQASADVTIDAGQGGTLQLGTQESQAIAIGSGFDSPDSGTIWIEPGPGIADGQQIVLQGSYADEDQGFSGGSVSITGGPSGEEGVGTVDAGGVFIYGGDASGSASGAGGVVEIGAGEGSYQEVDGWVEIFGPRGGSWIVTTYPDSEESWLVGTGSGQSTSAYITTEDVGDGEMAADLVIRGGDGSEGGSLYLLGGYSSNPASPASVIIRGGVTDNFNNGGGVVVDAGDSSAEGGEGGTIWIGANEADESNTRRVIIGNESDPSQEVIIHNFDASTMQGGTNGSPLIQLQYTHFKVDARGRSIEVGPIYYDPNTGETIKIGTQITACIYLEGDATNNTVRGGNGAETHVITLTTLAIDETASYNLSDASIDPASPLSPGTVTIRSMLWNATDYSEVTDDGEGAFPASALLPSGGTINYTTGAMTGTTAVLRAGSQVNAIYEHANADGEPLTPKGGDGVGTGDGGELRLKGGKGGATGDGADVNITSGDGGDTSGNSGDININTGGVTSGTIGVVNVGTGGTDYWTCTADGNIEKQVQGNYILTERRVVAVDSTPLTLGHDDSRTAYTNEGASEEIVINLPSAAAGLEYTFIVQDADGIEIVAASGDVIQVAGSTSSEGGNVSSNTVGNVITLLAINDGAWFATTTVGTWTAA